MFADLSPLRRVAATFLFCFCVAIIVVTLLGGLSDVYAVRLMQIIACGSLRSIVLAVVIAAITTRLGDYRQPADEEEFELLVRRSERLARDNLAAEPDEDEFLELDPYNPRDFEELVRDALDDLPDLLRTALDATSPS